MFLRVCTVQHGENKRDPIVFLIYCVIAKAWFAPEFIKAAPKKLKSAGLVKAVMVGTLIYPIPETVRNLLLT